MTQIVAHACLWRETLQTIFDLSFGFLYLVGLVLVLSCFRGPR